ncbi:hypothetical protein DL96DRAFT_1581688 [Flagelloscypha sp. PMI_526]|nr:hypothetical protein DL96DRAFT_1581688 [Flagelloscypha sp. PMI_526]
MVYFLKLLPLLISFCIIGFLELPGPGYYGEHRKLYSIFLSFFTAPYWSLLGDTKSRSIPYLAFLLGALICTVIEGTVGRNHSLIAALVAGGVEGLFDLSSPNSLFPKFYIVEASFSLSLILSPFRECWSNNTFHNKTCPGLLMFPYVWFILRPARPQAIALAEDSHTVSQPGWSYQVKSFRFLSIITFCMLWLEMLIASQLIAGFYPFFIDAVYLFFIKFVFALLIYLVTIMVCAELTCSFNSLLWPCWRMSSSRLGNLSFGLTLFVQCIAFFGNFSNPAIPTNVVFALEIVRHISSPYIPSLLLFLYLVWAENEEGVDRMGCFFGNIALIRMICPYQTFTFLVVWVSLGGQPTMFVWVASVILVVIALVCLLLLGKGGNAESEELPETSAEVEAV